ncbi:MAG: peptide deformylase [Planctomycetota bacterium]
MATDPSSLQIVHYPDPVLRRRAEPVDEVNDEVRTVIDRMHVLREQAEGIGLAAPQVGLAWRLFVVDVPEGDGRSADDDPPTASRGPMAFVNPELIEPMGELESMGEGCLSLPDITGDVVRPPSIVVRALDRDGQAFTMRAEGLLGRCFQHEFDHLEGVLIIDKMGQMDRLRNRSAIRSLEREARR